VELHFNIWEPLPFSIPGATAFNLAVMALNANLFDAVRQHRLFAGPHPFDATVIVFTALLDSFKFRCDQPQSGSICGLAQRRFRIMCWSGPFVCRRASMTDRHSTMCCTSARSRLESLVSASSRSSHGIRININRPPFGILPTRPRPTGGARIGSEVPRGPWKDALANLLSRHPCVEFY
jgi:hypothetical protein